MADTVDNAADGANAQGQRTIVPQFALNAADDRIASWSAAIVDAADTIDRLISSETAPIPDSVRELAATTTQKLRSFGIQSGEYDAAKLVGNLQTSAAAHPAASIGLGAVIGATLAGLLVRFGNTKPPGGNASLSTAADRRTAQDAKSAT